MKKQAIALGVITALTSTASHAVYNLYEKDGLSLDINGEVNLYLESNKSDAKGQAGTLSSIYEDLSDERIRLFPEQGASWIDFRGSQKLSDDWRVTGTVGMGYSSGNGGGYLNSANISFDKLNTGAISLGRQYLHTGYVTRTGTMTPLDVFGEQSIRLDYYGVPNLHTSAYYLFPSSTDVREESSQKTEGYGLSASYVMPLTGTQSVRFAGGYTNSKANASSVRTPVEKQGMAGSVEYRAGKFLAAADIGRMDAKLNSSRIAESEVDYWGAKLGYEVTPRFNVVAGYGKRKADTTRQAGVSGANIIARLTSDATSRGLSADLKTTFLYDSLTETRAYVRGDYYVRDNVRVYGQVQKDDITGKVAGVEQANYKDTAYRVGVSLTF